MIFKAFTEFVNTINSDLGDFCNQFQYKRISLNGKKKISEKNKLFVMPKGDEKWAINSGGGTEIQYHVSINEDGTMVKYGLGFNTQYVQFANAMSMVDYVRPYMLAFLNQESVIQNELNDYSFVYGNRDDIVNPKNGQFTLFGKSINCSEKEDAFFIDDKDYQMMISDFKRQFDIYKTIFEQRNKLITMDSNLVEIQKILEYKKQIILQGPPGTGKTRMAKILATEMTSPILSKNPLNIIEDFFKNYNDTDPELIKKRQAIKSTLENFQTRFPISSLKDLSLDEYCVGKGNRNNFCWWIETGLKDLGRYSPGKSNHYLIYYSNSQGAYIKNGTLVKDINDDNEAMKKLASVLSEAVIKKDFENGSKYFGDSFLLKIFNSYYPEEYFPVNGRDYLDNALTIFGVDSQNLNKDKKNLRLNEEFNKLKNRYKKDVNSFEFMSFLFKTFNLKEGIDTIEDHKIINKGETKLIQFHPAYTYEDFVRGITAKPNVNSQVEYKVEDKTLAQFGQRALDNPSANYVLIIDEINRANLPSVLGELIYALEYRFNPKEPDEKESTVDSIYSIADPDGSPESYEEGKKLKLPTNLYIIGTMNTADRSVGHIDYAIRRRFAFVDMLPTTDPLKTFALPYFKTVSELFIKNFDTIDWNNPKPERSDVLAPDFRPEDVWIGHSYFITEKDGKEGEEELKLKLEYEIKPILKEYLKDGILLESAKETIYAIS